MNRQELLAYIEENFTVDSATIRLIDNICVFVECNYTSRAAQRGALYDLLDNTIGLTDNEIDLICL